MYESMLLYQNMGRVNWFGLRDMKPALTLREKRGKKKKKEK